MPKYLSFCIFVVLACMLGCKPNGVSLPVVVPLFTKGYVAYYGDVRNTGAHTLSLDLYTSGLSLDSTGSAYVGQGRNLFFDDIFVSSTDCVLVDGTYRIDSTGAPYTFVAGQNQDGISAGAYVTSVSDMQISYEYLSLGEFVVKTKGDSTFIDFGLVTERGVKFEAHYSGILGWYDMMPTLSKGRILPLGNKYNELTSTYLLQLTSFMLDWDSDQIPTSGEGLFLDLTVDESSAGGLTLGKYEVAKVPVVTDDMQNFPSNAVIPYFMLAMSDGTIQNCGSWRTSYTQQRSDIVESGYVDISRNGDEWVVDYCFNPSPALNTIAGRYVGNVEVYDDSSAARVVCGDSSYFDGSAAHLALPKKLFRK